MGIKDWFSRFVKKDETTWRDRPKDMTWTDWLRSDESRANRYPDATYHPETKSWTWEQKTILPSDLGIVNHNTNKIEWLNEWIGMGRSGSYDFVDEAIAALCNENYLNMIVSYSQYEEELNMASLEEIDEYRYCYNSGDPYEYTLNFPCGAMPLFGQELVVADEHLDKQASKEATSALKRERFWFDDVSGDAYPITPVKNLQEEGHGWEGVKGWVTSRHVNWPSQKWLEGWSDDWVKNYCPNGGWVPAGKLADLLFEWFYLSADYDGLLIELWVGAGGSSLAKKTQNGFSPQTQDGSYNFSNLSKPFISFVPFSRDWKTLEVKNKKPTEALIFAVFGGSNRHNHQTKYGYWLPRKSVQLLKKWLYEHDPRPCDENYRDNNDDRTYPPNHPFHHIEDLGLSEK